MRNYCGLLMSPPQYRDFGYLIENKIVFHSSRLNAVTFERMWFSAGYSDSIYIVVSSSTVPEQLMLRVGILLDIRDMLNASNPSSFFDFAIERYASDTERIRLCNMIRDDFAKRPAIRWCGAEYESLYHRNLVQNAAEMNGLRDLGRSMNSEGVWIGTYPSVKCGEHSGDVYQQAMSFEDEGQRKLAVLFHSMCISGATIVYVGSAPGSAWISALEMYPNVHRIISVDPRPLASYEDPRIDHHSIYLLNDYDSCILIWDVRGDADAEDARDAII